MVPDGDESSDDRRADQLAPATEVKSDGAKLLQHGVASPLDRVTHQRFLPELLTSNEKATVITVSFLTVLFDQALAVYFDAPLDGKRTVFELAALFWIYRNLGSRSTASRAALAFAAFSAFCSCIYLATDASVRYSILTCVMTVVASGLAAYIMRLRRLNWFTAPESAAARQGRRILIAFAVLGACALFGLSIHHFKRVDSSPVIPIDRDTRDAKPSMQPKHVAAIIPAAELRPAATERYWREAILPFLESPSPPPAGKSTEQWLSAVVSDGNAMLKRLRSVSGVDVDADLLRVAERCFAADEKVCSWFEKHKSRLSSSEFSLKAEEAAPLYVELRKLLEQQEATTFPAELQELKAKYAELEASHDELGVLRIRLTERYPDRTFAPTDELN